MKNIIRIFLIFNLTFTFAQFNQNNLLIHYNFDGNANDSSGNNYHGTLNGPTFGEDRFGNANSAIYFDGINDYVDFPNLAALKPNLPVSFAFWVKYESTNVNDRAVFNTSFEEDRSSGIYFNSQSSTGNYAINYGDGTPAYMSSTRRSYVTNQAIDTDWHHIVIVVNSGTNMKIYVDCKDHGGVYSGTGGNLFYSSTPGSLGRHDRALNIPANYFKGALDDFRYFDRAITLNEISDLCNVLLSIEDEVVSASFDVTMHPNPATHILNINAKKANVDFIAIYNTMGQQVYYNKFTPTINVTNFKNGLYFVNFIKGDHIERKKLIVK